jgi:hypothetical protein
VRPHSRTSLSAALTVSATGIAVAVLLATTAVSASAAPGPVGLGTAGSFAVLAGETVTNTGPTVVSGDLGVSPGAAITNFPPGLVNGVQHAADAVALQAKSDLTAAYNVAAGRTPVTDKTDQDLGGQKLVAGVYQASKGMALTGTVTLDAENDPDAVFIFQAGSTLITASNSSVSLVNGANPCHVFWQVGSSATLDTGTQFVGTVMALTDVHLLTGTNVVGRVMARNGEVTLDTNTITQTGCALPSTAPSTSAATATPTPSPVATPLPTPSPSLTATSTASPPGGSPTATPTSTGGGGGTGGPGSGTPSTPSTTAPAGGGGGGNAGGAGGPGTPRIPTGHPGTGREPGATPTGSAWLLMGLISLTGAAGAGFLGWRVTAPQARRRH